MNKFPKKASRGKKDCAWALGTKEVRPREVGHGVPRQKQRLGRKEVVRMSI